VAILYGEWNFIESVVDAKEDPQTVLPLYWAPSRIAAVRSHNRKAMIPAQSSHLIS